MAKITVIVDRCKGCGLCTVVCPQDLLKIGNMINEQGYSFVRQIGGKECKGCKLCAEICPDLAIEVWK